MKYRFFIFFCIDDNNLTTIFEQGNQVMVANLGDSRAVMIGTSDNGETKVVQLTNDLKPSVPSKFLKLWTKVML